MKKQLLVLPLLAAVMLFCNVSCSNDDEVTPAPTYQVPATDAFRVVEDSIQMELSLLNERGETTQTFDEGEDILFKIIFRNISNNTIYCYDHVRKVFTENTFRVYTNAGVDMGVPWCFPNWKTMMYGTLPPNKFIGYTCPWSVKEWDMFDYGQRPGISMLPAGNYYVIAPVVVCDTIHLNCGAHFQILKK